VDTCSPPSPSISLEELEAQITELAGHLNAANYRWLLLIAEFDRRKGWADGKLPSCAQRTHTELGVPIDSKTAATRWRGERMDYELGVWVLCNQVDRARTAGRHDCDVSAETHEHASM
jgi:hypothetical protein